MRHLRTDDLRAIIASGGGLDVNVSHLSPGDLQSLAAAAGTSQHKPRLVFRGVAHLHITALQAIAAAGVGCVVFGE
jgi:hypothetical protein